MCVLWVIYLLLNIWRRCYSIPVEACKGVVCLNSSTVATSGHTCVCLCNEGFTGVRCEFEMKESVWPSGSYALPKSIEGCPEQPIKYGWREGYIHIMMSLPAAVFLSNKSQNDVSNNPWFDVFDYGLHHQSLIGPFDRHALQFNFCSRTEGYPVSENIGWPSGNYKIYKSRDKACPNGFVESYESIRFFNVSSMNMDGFLPEINITKSTDFSAIIKITSCRTLLSSENYTRDHTFREQFGKFILVKDGSNECPTFDQFNETTEILMISDTRSEQLYYNAENATNVLQHCVYVPANSANGEMHTVDLMSSNSPFIENVMALVQQIMAQDMAPWILLDLGSSVEITAVLSAIGIDGEISVDLNPKVIPEMYISDHKWHFLSYGAEQIGAQIYYGDLLYMYMHVFTRPKRGTYLSIYGSKFETESDVVMYLLHSHQFHVLSNCGQVDPTYTSDCQRTLGMGDNGILDFQLSSSPAFLPENTVSQSRPFHNGWCAAYEDINPYIKVDLLINMIIEGVQVTNIYLNKVDIEHGKLIRDRLPRGVQSFKVLYGSSEDNMYTYDLVPFQVDTRSEGPHDFLFQQPVYARYIELRPVESFEITCITFELIGCRHTGFPSLVCESNSSASVISNDNIYVATNDPVISTHMSSRNGCISLCLENANECSALQFEDGMCNLYAPPKAQNYQIMPGHGVWMQTICVKESIPATTLMLSAATSTLGPVTVVTRETVLTSIGYPFYYVSAMDYGWKIQFEEGTYVSLVFANIDFVVNIVIENSICVDTLHLFTQRHGVFDASYSINNTYNGLLPTFAFDYHEVWVRLKACRISTPALSTGNGFRLFVTQEDTPTCPPLSGHCTMDTMVLASWSFFGILNRLGVMQIWDIELGTNHLIMLDINHFYVRCDSGSVFSIAHSFQDPITYCNGRRPLFVWDLLSNSATVKFLHSQRFDYTLYEGFQLTYRSRLIYVSDMDDSISQKICNRKFGKCYFFHYGIKYPISWEEASMFCNREGQAMVSFDSEEEMETVRKYVLAYSNTIDEYEHTSSGQGWLFFSGNSTVSSSRSDPTGYMYLGLYRSTDEESIMHEIWLNGHQLQFTKWSDGQPDQPSKRRCTRLLFDYAKRPSTHYLTNWETTLCSATGPGAASYFVCEEPFAPNDISKPLTEVGLNLNASIPVHVHSSTLFKCSSGEIISILSQCNGVAECIDRSDEDDCSPINPPINADMDGCGSNMFRCYDGRCIHVSRTCNYISDCSDSEDENCEYPVCDVDQYTCMSGQCVKGDQRCDGKPDCFDSSDEFNCDSCNGANFLCGNRVCIPSYRVCDKYPDCNDASDENLCFLTARKSCEQLWEDGHTESRFYDFGKFNIECDFDELHTSNLIRAKLHDVSTWSNYEMSRYAVIDHLLLQDFANIHPTSNCSMKIFQTCEPATLRVLSLDGNSSIYSEECRCLYQQTVIPLQELAFTSTYEFCGMSQQNETIDAKNVSQILDNRNDNCRSEICTPEYGPVPYIRFYTDPVICEYEYVPGEKKILCADGHNTFTDEDRCLYASDSINTITRCRSLDHLQDCEAYVCEDNYFKCPNSYCIPIWLVCDGEEDCPNAEDEIQCRCDTGRYDINILYFQDDHETTDRVVFNFAKKFYSEESEVRLLKVTYVEKTAGSLSLNSYLKSVDSWLINVQERYLNSTQFYLGRYSTSSYSIHLNDNDGVSFLDQLFVNRSLNRNITFMIIESGLLKVLYPGFYEDLIYRRKQSNVETIYNIYKDRSAQGPVSMYRMDNVVTVGLAEYSRLSDLDPTLFREICSDTKLLKFLPCKNGYRCEASRVCLPMDQVCNGIVQCPLRDDELLCNFTCPEKCSCSGLSVHCKATSFILEDVRNISKQTRLLDISQNPLVGTNEFEIKILPLLTFLNISSCDILGFVENAFDAVHNLMVLDISNNKFEILTGSIFHKLTYLRQLILHDNNRLRIIEPGTFEMLSNIRNLAIVGTNLDTLQEDTFSGLFLDSLEISNNPTKTIHGYAFRGLTCRLLTLVHNQIKNFDNHIFSGVKLLATLNTPAYKFCCVRPSYLNENDCYPHKDEFSSCSDLMRNTILQALLWVIGLSSLLGNMMSLIYRLKFDRTRLKLGYGIFVTNLAIADFVMGVYLIIIAIADVTFRNRYILYDEQWRTGSVCSFAGILSTVSSEASVLFMCLITVDRILVIKYPFGQIGFKKKSAIVASLICWSIAITIAVAPVVFTSYFKGEFYSRSGVCLALPLTKDKPPGWRYSITVFIGFNFATFVLIAIGQCMLYGEIKRQSSKVKRQSARRKDLTIARNLFIVVATDFLCWFPIGCMGIMALLGHSISGDIYAWSAVLILPINSALNPFLYTLSAIIAQKSFTPSVDEQSRSPMYKEIGSAVFKFWKHHHSYFKVIRSNDECNGLTGDGTTTYSLTEVCINKQLTPRMAVTVLYKIMLGLNLLHKCNIVHGHLSSDHVEVVLCTQNYVVKHVLTRVGKGECSVSRCTENDIYDVGGLTRKLINSCKTKILIR